MSIETLCAVPQPPQPIFAEQPPISNQAPPDLIADNQGRKPVLLDKKIVSVYFGAFFELRMRPIAIQLQSNGIQITRLAIKGSVVPLISGDAPQRLPPYEPNDFDIQMWIKQAEESPDSGPSAEYMDKMCTIFTEKAFILNISRVEDGYLNYKSNILYKHGIKEVDLTLYTHPYKPPVACKDPDCSGTDDSFSILVHQLEEGEITYELTQSDFITYSTFQRSRENLRRGLYELSREHAEQINKGLLMIARKEAKGLLYAGDHKALVTSLCKSFFNRFPSTHPDNPAFRNAVSHYLSKHPSSDRVTYEFFMKFSSYIATYALSKYAEEDSHGWTLGHKFLQELCILQPRFSIDDPYCARKLSEHLERQANHVSQPAKSRPPPRRSSQEILEAFILDPKSLPGKNPQEKATLLAKLIKDRRYSRNFINQLYVPLSALLSIWKETPRAIFTVASIMHRLFPNDPLAIAALAPTQKPKQDVLEESLAKMTLRLKNPSCKSSDLLDELAQFDQLTQQLLANFPEAPPSLSAAFRIVGYTISHKIDDHIRNFHNLYQDHMQLLNDYGSVHSPLLNLPLQTYPYIVTAHVLSGRLIEATIFELQRLIHTTPDKMFFFVLTRLNNAIQSTPDLHNDFRKTVFSIAKKLRNQQIVNKTQIEEMKCHLIKLLLDHPNSFNLTAPPPALVSELAKVYMLQKEYACAQACATASSQAQVLSNINQESKEFQ